MDNDFNSPVAKHFKDDRLDLNDDATLWLSFYPLHGEVSFQVYDRAAGDRGAHTLEFRPGSDVKAFAQSVKDRYGVKVPVRMQKLVAEFVAAAPSIVGLSANLDEGREDGLEHGYSCEQCGDWNVNTVQAFFMPATATVPASIAFHWEFGCYGGDGVSGRAEDVVSAVKEKLSFAASEAHSEAVASQIQEFIAMLPA